MIFSSLTPTGNPVLLEKSNADLNSMLPGYALKWLDSGTSALAFCLLEQKRKHSDIETPEVIVPGYCCPDLLSAALYAGYKPVIVDICENDPSYDLEQLKLALNGNTLAVIAINFFGVRERLNEVRNIIQVHSNVALIEDNAQWFPEENELDSLVGDYITFSFGRGKAVSLLGGGLVATKIQLNDEINYEQDDKSLVWPLKVKLLGMLSSPFVYYWLEKLPFLSIGSTVYHKHNAITLMSKQKKQYIFKNILAYRTRSRDVEKQIIVSIQEKNNFEAVTDLNRSCRLLRYPFLAKNNKQREVLLQKGQKQGLGLSSMYRTALKDVDGVKELNLDFPELQNAQSFAERFITVPTHEGVKKSHLRKLQSIFC